MMVAIFTSMGLALGAARLGPRWFALAALLVCLALSTGEFLWEIYSPMDGFRLPWLQATDKAISQAMFRAGRPS